METFRSQFKVQMKNSSIRSDKDDTDIPLSWKECSNMTTKIAQELIKTLKVLSSDLKE